MKKFWIVLLSLLLSLACVMGFAACDETPPDDETGGIVQPGDPSGPDDPDDPGKPHEHDFGEWTVTIPATCTEEGEEQRLCKRRLYPLRGYDRGDGRFLFYLYGIGGRHLFGRFGFGSKNSFRGRDPSGTRRETRHADRG